MRNRLLACSILLGLAMASPVTPALAAPCKDARGKFVKCPPPPAAKPVRCKDAKGKFVKCGLPGAKPTR